MDKDKHGVTVDWQRAVLPVDATVSQAIKILDEVSLRIVLIVDQRNQLVGTITDGDVRRGLVGYIDMQESVELIMNKNPVTAPVELGRDSILKLMMQWDILQVPVVDSNRQIVDVEFLQSYPSREAIDNPVILMAGGVGERLYPLTADIPKPMLKVGNRPILESIVEQLAASGFHNLYISIFFKGEVLKEHFGDGSAWGISIEYLEEAQPLGTGGAVSLLPEIDNDLPLVVINGDVLAKVNYRRLLDFHKEQEGELTICVREHDLQVPYGVVEMSGLDVKKLVEKPTHKFFVNAGIYIISRELANTHNSEQRIDMPDLVNFHIEKGKRIKAYPLHEYWIDIGLMDQYEKAQIDFGYLFDDR